jgi:hypothetical protein
MQAASAHARAVAACFGFLLCALAPALAWAAPATPFVPDASLYAPASPAPGAPFQALPEQLTGLVGNGTTFNIAVIVQCASYSPDIPVPAVNTTLLTSVDPMEFMAGLQTVFAMQLSADDVLNKCLLGSDFNSYIKSFTLFQKKVNRQCNGGIIPTVNTTVGTCGVPLQSFDPVTKHQLRAKINLVYFNIGPLPFPGTPEEAYTATTVTNALTLASMLAPSPDVLPLTGFLLGHFPVVINSMYGDEYFDQPFAAACDISKTCLTVSPFGTTANFLTCVVQPLPPAFTSIGCPAECANKGGCRGQRRFDFGFSPLFDSVPLMSTQTTQMRIRGAKTVAIFSSGNFGFQRITTVTAADIKQKGMTVVLTKFTAYDQLTNKPILPIPTAAETAAIAAEIIAADPDVVMFLAHAGLQTDYETFINTLVAFKAANWWPRAICTSGAIHVPMAARLADVTGDATDAGFIYGSVVRTPDSNTQLALSLFAVRVHCMCVSGMLTVVCCCSCCWLAFVFWFLR